MSSTIGSIPEGSRIILDTSVLVAYLGGSEPVSPRATALVEGRLMTQRNEGVISTITVAELLIRPLRAGQQAADEVIAFLWSIPDLLVRAVDVLVAAEAARIRAATGIALSDATILATAVLTSSDALVTNDRVLADVSGSAVPGLRVLLLGDLRA